MDGGQWVDMQGVCPGFRAPRAKIGYPSMSMTIGCGRHISGPPEIWIEVGSQGVPQTGKIIEVKKTTLRVLFFDTRGLGSVVLGCMARSDVSGALAILTDVAKSEFKLFCPYFQAK